MAKVLNTVYSSGSDLYKIGDILTTARTDLNDGWALCNGDIIINETNQEINDLLSSEGKTLLITYKNYIPYSSFSNNTILYDIKKVGNYYFAYGKDTINSVYKGRIWYSTSFTGTWEIVDIFSSTSSSDTFVSDIAYDETANKYIFCGSEGATPKIAYATTPNGTITSYSITNDATWRSNAGGDGVLLAFYAVFGITKLTSGKWEIILASYSNSTYTWLTATITSLIISATSVGTSSFIDGLDGTTENKTRMNTATAQGNNGYRTYMELIKVNGKRFIVCRKASTGSSSYPPFYFYETSDGVFSANSTSANYQIKDIYYKNNEGYCFFKNQTGNFIYLVFSSDFSSYTQAGTEGILKTGFEDTFTSFSTTSSNMVVCGKDIISLCTTGSDSTNKIITLTAIIDQGNGKSVCQPFGLFNSSTYDFANMSLNFIPSLFKNDSTYNGYFAIWRTDGLYFYEAKEAESYSILPTLTSDKVYNYIKVK